MNTPAHGIISLMMLDHGKGNKNLTLPIALGAILPEAPIFLFWLIQKFILSKPEAWIWSLTHDRPAWQLSVDLLNSLPIILIALLITLWIKHSWLIAFFASAALHLLCDLPFHGKEAWQHWLPFKHWQLDDCISYQQSATGESWHFFTEIALVLIGSLYLIRKKTQATRIAAIFFLVSYAACLIYAWSN
ncbi:MAG: hypothetical protein L3J39_00450 [Verrucomicrobiales bacterium]|nr:hypothetical protein [Verrucomicrobiales bacterium]